MTLSKATILEMLWKQSEDLDTFIQEMNMPGLGPELREVNSPVKLLIAWLTEELKNG